MLKIAVLAALLSLASSAEEGKAWTYSGQTGTSAWARMFPTCSKAGNPRQSPIDISDRDAMHMPFPAPVMGPGYYTPKTIKMFNTGKTVKFEFAKDPQLSVIATDRNGQERQYTLAQGHFHWGATHHPAGSEHTHNGEQFTAELHLVHYHSRFNDIGEAVEKGDQNSLLVLGIFIQMEGGHYHFESTKSGDYMNIFGRFMNVHMQGNSTYFDITPSSLIPTNDHVFNYDGGLTTPGCNGIVQWYVFAEPIVLPKDPIMMAFMNMNTAPKDSHNQLIGPNYRPVEPLGARMVRTNKKGHDQGTPTAAAGFTTTSLTLLILSAMLATQL